MQSTLIATRLAAALLGVVVLTGLSGCGDNVSGQPVAVPPPPSSPSASPSEAPSASDEPAEPDTLPEGFACTLVTQAEATEIAGVGVGEPNPAGAACLFTSPPTGNTAQVEVGVGPGAKKFLDIQREIGHVLTPLTGLGDEAYQEDENVFFRKGGVWVSLHLVRLDNETAANRKPMEALARKMVTRL